MAVLSGYIYVRKDAPKTAKVVERSIGAFAFIYSVILLFGDIVWSDGAHKVAMVVAGATYYDGKAELQSAIDAIKDNNPFDSWPSIWWCFGIYISVSIIDLVLTLVEHEKNKKSG